MMARLATWCILGACTGLTACITDSVGVDLGPFTFDPVTGELDGAPPFGNTIGTTIPMMSADLGGVSDVDASIVFNTDGTFTVTLPGGTAVTVADADSTAPPQPDSNLGTIVESFLVDSGTWQVDVHLGEDAATGRDLFLLARVDDATGLVAPSPMAYMLFGDETDTLPSGNALYSGGFIADVFDGVAGTYIEQRVGTADIDADFTGSTVDVTLTEGGESGAMYTATALPMTGARYAGTISGSGYSGDLMGAFFGDNAEQTAGTFGMQDATTDMIGAFAATQ